MPAKVDKPYTVRRSAIHGRGVFAKRVIRRGERIIEYKGQRVSWDVAMERPDSDPDDPANAARWINHSCAPNCVTCEDDDGRVFIEAKRAIKPGEELSYDYKLIVDGKLTKKERASYTCRCGKPQCRGSLLDPKR
jgi:SET domain-containing protein